MLSFHWHKMSGWNLVFCLEESCTFHTEIPICCLWLWLRYASNGSTCWDCLRFLALANQRHGIQHAFYLCTNGMVSKYRLFVYFESVKKTNTFERKFKTKGGWTFSIIAPLRAGSLGSGKIYVLECPGLPTALVGTTLVINGSKIHRKWALQWFY